MAKASKNKPKKSNQVAATVEKTQKKTSAIKTEKKIMVVSLEPVKRKVPQAPPPPATVNKDGKALVEVSFGGQTSESDLEPLARSARQAEKEAKRKKSKSEEENKFEARTATDKKQGIEVKSDAGEVISAPEAPAAEDSRNLASSTPKKDVPAKPISELYRNFQKQVENEVDEDYN